jgi:signal peptidase I
MVPTPILGSSLRITAYTLGLALILLVGVRAVAVDAYSIPTSSMESTLMVGDFLLVNKLVFGGGIPGAKLTLPPFRGPRRGEIIVFHPPHDSLKHYVKRIVGLPGDTLEMRRKVLLLNGEPLEETYAQHVDVGKDPIHPGMKWQTDHLVAAGRSRTYTPSRDTWGPIVVPEGGYFVLGDNRDNSEDSRYWGFVDRSSIRGVPWLVYFSVEGGGAPAGALGRIRWRRIGDRIH